MRIALTLVALAVALAAPGEAAAKVRQAQLLARYQPVTVLHPLETFAPARVDPFLAGATLEERSGTGQWRPADPQPARADELPVGGADCGGPCWRLNFRACAPDSGLASVECYATAQAAPAPSVVYGGVRVTRDRLVLEYWYWYAYNFWSGLHPPSDYVWRAHEGDWEVVAVVLTKTGAPLYVGYSQHCSGKRRAWAKVPKRPRTHPLVYVGLGSHANWFTAGPDQRQDMSCYEPAAAVVFRSYLGTVLDRTGRGRTFGPAGLAPERTTLVRVTDTSPRWMRYRGLWGETGYAHFPPPLETVTYGAGPEGPAFHAMWQRPVATLIRWPEG